MSNRSSQMRWDPYVLMENHEFDDFWRDHLSSQQRRLLFVLGRGFDQRALAAIRRIIEIGARPTVWLMAFENGLEDSEVRRNLTEENRRGLEKLVGELQIRELAVGIGGAAYSNATSRSTRRAIGDVNGLTMFDDVIVDVSAMPRMVALTTVATLLHDLDEQAQQGGKNTNLHVVTAESVNIDSQIFGSLMDEMTTVVGFSGHLTEQTSEHVPRVWFPILGERQHDRLELIQNRLDPDEICPVIPFPSRNPRRGDDIVTDHRAILFENFQVEPSNILRASEFNPFEAYKQLFGAMDRYRRALGELGGCKAFVSPLSSKLLSIASLLACYDHRYGAIEGAPLKVGIPYVETAIYQDPKPTDETGTQLYSMWIRGEWEQ